ncbi:MAG: hypothetical protein LAO30_01865 [Acidobacteriia bacterium]|nr:hypothetical protein [Terriglobia bacterium]
MPIRRESSISGTLPVAQSNRTFSFLNLMCALLFYGVIACGSTTAAVAQETKPQTQVGTSSAGQAPSAPSKVPGAALYNLLQKKSIVFPNIASSTERLSTTEKFKLFADDSISVHTITWAALGSSIGQADNSPTGFGQGWDAYAKRFGSSMARQASSNFFGEFVLASALHQDPRFYPEVNPSFGHAVKYSVQRVFVTRTDDGRDVTNWSGLAGPLMSEGLANVYWPERNRSVGDTFLRFGLDIATRAGGNMLREYWPVFYGKINHSSRRVAGNN